MLPHNSNTYNEILSLVGSSTLNYVVTDLRDIREKYIADLIFEENVDQRTIIQGKLRVISDLIEDYTKVTRQSMSYSTRTEYSVAD
jgi:hypothetical protein